MKTPNCPRCHKPLTPGTLGGVDLNVCGACEGIMVAQRRLVPLLSAMAGELLDGIDLDYPLEPMPNTGADCVCPSCAGQLKTSGYMGTDLVYPSRCGRCEVIWADPGELGLMSLLYARTERRVAKIHDTETRQRREQETQVYTILKQRMINRILTVGLF